MNYKMLTIIFCFFLSSQDYSSSYDIENFYEAHYLDSETLAKTSDGNIEEIEEIFIITKIDIGKYSVSITREDKDFYRIDGTDIYIRTRYCYEYCYSDDAVLVVDSNYGYSKGKLIFVE